MSWLNLILEDILNEVGSEDAYNRFYSSIPREEYDKIVNGRPNIDKFVQFFLNSVRDGNISANDAKEILDEYESSDPSIRQIIITKFRDGEYEDPYDIGGAISSIKKTGITSRKKFAKEGLVKIAENNKWIMTTTLNYEASNHYFGMTHWCTASDRDGRYDGYEMFRSYTIDRSSFLIQIKSKVKENEMYQMQVDKDGEVGQICDFMDENMDFDDLDRIVSETDFLTTPLHSKLANKIYTLTKEMAERERIYQNSKDEYRRKRIELKMALSRQRLDNMEAECDRFNEEVDRKKDVYWEEIVNNKLYNNEEFIKTLYSLTHGMDINEEDADKCKYMCLCEEIPLDNEDEYAWSLYKAGRRILGFSMIYGEGKDVDENDEGVYYINTYFDGGTIRRDTRGFYVMCDVDEDYNITKIYGNSSVVDGGNIVSETIYNIIDEEYSNDFIFISSFNGDGCIYYKKLNKFIPTKASVLDRCIATEDACYIFRDDYLDDNEQMKNSLLALNKNGDVIMDIPDAIFKDNYTRYDNSDCVVIYLILNNKPFIICGKRGRHGTGAAFWGPEEITNVSFLGNGVIKWYKNEKCNISFLKSPKEFIFGVWGTNGGILTSKAAKGVQMPNNLLSRYYECPYVNLPYSTTLLIYDMYLNEGYFLYDADKKKFYNVDKNGEEDEKAKIAKHNLQKWQERGGHSPEVKAQMDAMWNDNAGNSHHQNADRAMKDWDDVDLFKDFENNNNSIDPDDFEKDPNWRGAIGYKDPTDLSRGVYKIGKDGKPLEQPWNDEDEIHANLSESVKKMFRLIDDIMEL